MIPELSDNFGTGKTHGWILYDGACPYCLDLLERFRSQIAAAGVLAAPLQSDWVRERLQLPDDRLLEEMKLLLATGQVYGGAEAVFQFARSIPRRVRPTWAWAVAIFARLPFAHRLAGTIYRYVAARRYCTTGMCVIPAASMRGKSCAQ